VPCSTHVCRSLHQLGAAPGSTFAAARSTRRVRDARKKCSAAQTPVSVIRNSSE
jgi:hypothetical protein